MDDALILQAARELSELLNRKLADPEAKAILLSREEALLALGLVDGAAELLARDVARKA